MQSFQSLLNFVWGPNAVPRLLWLLVFFYWSTATPIHLELASELQAWDTEPVRSGIPGLKICTIRPLPEKVCRPLILLHLKKKSTCVFT